MFDKPFENFSPKQHIGVFTISASHSNFRPYLFAFTCENNLIFTAKCGGNWDAFEVAST